MDRPITKVPGMESFLPYRDLPSFCRSSDMEDPSLQLMSKNLHHWASTPSPKHKIKHEKVTSLRRLQRRGGTCGMGATGGGLGSQSNWWFFTHSGWNSTLESIVAGVPMICWPFFADQQRNSRFVSEVWKLGLDMKDVCDRKIVEKMVNDLMVERREELFASATRFPNSNKRQMKPTQTNATIPSPPPPHVLIFPLPAQGHVNPMLKLAQLLGIVGLDISFLNSEYNHERLVRHTNIQARLAQYPGFRFRSILDGLLADHPRSGVAVKELFESLNTRVKPILKDMLDEIRPPLTCIIGDGFM
ncbi:hypothetical protein Tsubulata_029768, partial [Turnera subulata]